jgi:rubrerythrin
MDEQRPLSTSGDRPMTGITRVGRAALLRRTAIALGGIAAGGAAAAGLADASGKSAGDAHSGPALSRHDRQVLELALRFEQLQTAFYGAAVRRGQLTGEARQFAQTVAHEERQHLAYIEHALGGHTAQPPKFSFGDAATSDKQFVAAAAKIEETGLAAYNGQAENVSRATLASLARVISVEARHAAWARSLAGELPAPVAVDVPITASQALHEIKPYLA